MSFPLGRQTIAALVEALSVGYSHTELTTAFIRVGAADSDPGPERANKATRAQQVLLALERAQEDQQEASRAALELASGALTRATKHGIEPIWLADLSDALAADGFEFDPAAQRVLPAVDGVSVADQRTLLERQLEAHRWSTGAAHYRQAVDNVAVGNWEAANGQLRSFLEFVIPRAAQAREGGRLHGDPLAALQGLQASGTLDAGEFDFGRGLWKICNTRGAHAGLSDSEEARFRLLTVTAYARFLMSRLA